VVCMGCSFTLWQRRQSPTETCSTPGVGGFTL
jgi:hypothetical protein